MREAAKNVLSTLFRFALSGALLVWLYNRIDVEKTAEVVKSANIGYILYGLGIFLILNMVVLYRWWGLIRALSLEAHFTTAMRYFFIGLFGNLFLPSAIGGDVIKILGLCSSSQQKPKVVASVLLDRLSGFAGLALVAIVSFIFGYRYIQDISLLIVILILGGVCIAIIAVLFDEPVYSFCCRIFTPFPKLKTGLMNMHYDIVLLKGNMIALYKAILISALVQVALAYIFFLIAKALHQDVGYFYFLIFVPLICVSASVPSIGGLGVREAGAVYLLAKVGVDSGVAVSISLMSFIFMVIVGLIGGVVFMCTKTTLVKKPDGGISVVNSA